MTQEWTRWKTFEESDHKIWNQRARENNERRNGWNHKGIIERERIMIEIIGGRWENFIRGNEEKRRGGNWVIKTNRGRDMKVLIKFRRFGWWYQIRRC